MVVAIRFPNSELRAKGFLLLAKNGIVRTLRGEVYVCSEKALAALDTHRISYIKVSLPVNQDEVDALRNTPTTVL
jgi:hypothetical protein